MLEYSLGPSSAGWLAWKSIVNGLEEKLSVLGFESPELWPGDFTLFSMFQSCPGTSLVHADHHCLAVFFYLSLYLILHHLMFFPSSGFVKVDFGKTAKSCPFNIGDQDAELGLGTLSPPWHV